MTEQELSRLFIFAEAVAADPDRLDEFVAIVTDEANANAFGIPISPPGPALRSAIAILADAIRTAGISNAIGVLKETSSITGLAAHALECALQK